jgi:hypothetical protein
MSVQVRYRILREGALAEEIMTMTDPSDVARLIELLSTEAGYGATAHHSNRSGLADGAPDHELVVGILNGHGALYYNDENGTWYSEGDTPEGDGPVFAELDFPPHCEVPPAVVQQALEEFLTSPARPTCVQWQEDPYS